MKRLIIYILLLLAAFWGLDRTISTALNYGLKQYFGIGSNADILMIGHSHLMLAVDKERLEQGLGVSVAKYCREGVNVFDRQRMIQHYLDTCSSPPKLVLYSVDPFLFTGKELSSNSYKLFYPFMDSPVMDAYIRREVPDSWDYWMHRLIHTSRYSDALIGSALRGWLHDWANLKFGQISEAAFRRASLRPMDFEQSYRHIFENSIKLLTGRGIKVILINTPVSYGFARRNSKDYERMISYFRNFAAGEKFVSCIDYNPDYSHNYTIFYDLIHVNPRGQKILTERMIVDLQPYISNTP